MMDKFRLLKRPFDHSLDSCNIELSYSTVQLVHPAYFPRWKQVSGIAGPDDYRVMSKTLASMASSRRVFRARMQVAMVVDIAGMFPSCVAGANRRPCTR